MKLHEKVEQIVNEAFEHCTGFPPDEDEIITFVRNKIALFYADGNDLHDMATDRMWEAIPEGNLTGHSAKDVVNLVIRQELDEEALREIISRMEYLHTQKNDFDIILDAADDLGIQARWKHDDYVFLWNIQEKTTIFWQDVLAYIVAPGHKEEAARQRMAVSQPSAIGLPVSNDTADWRTFAAKLATLNDLLYGYVTEYGASDAAMQQHFLWEDIVTRLKEFSQYDQRESRLQQLKFHAKKLQEELVEYLALVYPTVPF